MDIQKLRAETPGTKHIIHFNNAGSSLPTQSSLDKIMGYLEEEAIVGGYRINANYQEEVDTFYRRAGQLINASPDEIAITGSASESFNKVLYSIPFQKGDIILTSEIEYGNSFVNFINLKNTLGIEIQIIRNLPNGDFDLESLENAINEKVKLISVTHIPTSSGVVVPVAAIGKIANAHNILYLVDACQSIGQMPFDVERIGCDFVSATSRKYLRGPRGLGFLYIRKLVIGKLNPQTLDTVTANWKSEEIVELEKSTKMFENWEKSFALIMGLSEAIKYLLELGVENTWSRIQELASYTRQRLISVEGVEVHDPGSQKCGIVTFTKKGIDPISIQKILTSKNINTSVSLPFSSLTDMQNRGLESVVRASVHYFNTKEEIDLLVGEVEKMQLHNSGK
jgi:cysteine desulfurase / selenocysteine lyase